MEEYSAADLTEAKYATEWARAVRLAQDLAAGYTAGHLAAQCHLSRNQVVRYAHAAEVFANPADRAPDFPFDLHEICARQPDPFYWRDWMVTHQASRTDLYRAIREAAQHDDGAAWMRRGDWLVYQWRKWCDDGNDLEQMGRVLDQMRWIVAQRQEQPRRQRWRWRPSS